MDKSPPARKSPTPQRFAGKRAVVTASTDGIGLAIARRLAQEGAHVLISSRSQQHVDATLKRLKEVEKLQVDGIVCHVSKPKDRENLVKAATCAYTQKVDVLVSNAAVSPYVGMTVDITDSQYDKIMDVNVKATLFLVQQFQPHFAAGGTVLIISSYVGYNPRFPLGMYGVSKTALFGLTKTLAHDMWEKNHIRVNCIAPGVIRTNFSRVIWEDNASFNETKNEIIMGKAGEAIDIGGPAAFLCSEDASYITGETLVVGGGVFSKL